MNIIILEALIVFVREKFQLRSFPKIFEDIQGTQISLTIGALHTI